MPARTSDATVAPDAGADAPQSDARTTRGDRALLIVFWVWAALLLAATLAHLFGWDGVLDALDVKKWFAR